MLVMGGALLVSVPVFQSVLRAKTLPRPLSAAHFDLPSKTKVDAQLVAGALIFGAGERPSWCRPASGACCFVAGWACVVLDWLRRPSLGKGCARHQPGIKAGAGAL